MDAAAYETFARNEKSHFWFRGRRAIFFDLIRRHFGPGNPEARVFDLGCGVGGMLGQLGEFGQVMGMDIDSGSLEFCADRGFPQVFNGRGHCLPLANNSVDLLLAFDVLEHIPEEAETIAECFRVLKPGGKLLLSGPAYQFLYTHQDKMVHHERRYTVGDIKAKFRTAGFVVLQASYINFFLFPIILPVVLLKKFREWISPPKDSETRFNTDMKIPKIVNSVFAKIFGAERFVLRCLSMPLGHSLILMVEKPETN